MFGFGKKSISDLPVGEQSDVQNSDQLKNSPYAEALAKFIERSDTPITIGIQGGWGSGKTSLMNMLERKISDSSLVVKINAWEYSLFSRKEDVASSLITGLIAELRGAIEEACQATPRRVGEDARKAALDLPTFGEQALHVAKGVIKSAVGFGVRASTGNLIGNLTETDCETSNDVKTPDTESSRANVVFSVKELKKALTKSIRSIMNDPLRSTVQHPIDQIVFLIDDLDRVDPSVAVQILDILKNVMELRDCVFILAIDFDVVVQGLRSKFGDKSNQTEREHRQYFDKIIQVPFAMPVNAYRDRISALVTGLLDGIGIPCDEGQAKTLAQHAWALTDGTPRSIKRVVNTLSLLSLLPNDAQHEAESDDMSPDELEILFALVCLQINFPSVFNQIARTPNINEWTITDLPEEASFSEIGNEEIEDDWRLVLEVICEDPWSKKKKREVERSLSAIYDGPIRNIGGNAKLATILAKLSVTNINAGSFVEAVNGIYDYFTLGGMTAKSVMNHNKCSDMIYQIHALSGVNEKNIKKILSASPDTLVKDAIDSYGELERNLDIFADWTVADARLWNIFNVISKCLSRSISEIQSTLDDKRGNTKLRNALADYWQ